MTKKRKASRVFVLGAGASASCGLPVSQNILNKAMAHLQDHDGAKWDGIVSLLEYLYPSFNTALRNYPNIEDFMNLIEMAIEFNSEDYIQSTLWPDKKLADVKKAVLQMVTDYIWSMMKTCNREPVKKFVDHCLRTGDAIVTFNWDLTIENALESSGRFDFWYAPTAEILLLKPHGSVDWFLRNELPREVASRDVKKIDDSLCVYPEFSLAKYQRLKQIAPVIVPPVFQKDFGRPFFRETLR